MQVTHRATHISDHGFICSCLLAEARKGHFSIDVEDRHAVQRFRKDITAMLNDGLTQDSYTFLLNGQRIGFAIINHLQGSPGSRELYVLSVAKKFRKLGYGQQMLDIVMEKLQRHIVYVRCAPGSLAMKNMLLKRGFQDIQETDQGIRIFKRDTLAAVDIAAGSGACKYVLQPIDARLPQAQISGK